MGGDRQAGDAQAYAGRTFAGGGAYQPTRSEVMSADTFLRPRASGQDLQITGALPPGSVFDDARGVRYSQSTNLREPSGAALSEGGTPKVNEVVADANSAKTADIVVHKDGSVEIETNMEKADLREGYTVAVEEGTPQAVRDKVNADMQQMFAKKTQDGGQDSDTDTGPQPNNGGRVDGGKDGGNEGGNEGGNDESNPNDSSVNENDTPEQKKSAYERAQKAMTPDVLNTIHPRIAGAYFRGTMSDRLRSLLNQDPPDEEAIKAEMQKQAEELAAKEKKAREDGDTANAEAYGAMSKMYKDKSQLNGQQFTDFTKELKAFDKAQAEGKLTQSQVTSMLTPEARKAIAIREFMARTKGLNPDSEESKQKFASVLADMQMQDTSREK